MRAPCAVRSALCAPLLLLLLLLLHAALQRNTTLPAHNCAPLHSPRQNRQHRHRHQVHVAYENNFWATKMALPGASAAELARTKTAYDAFLGDAARLSAARAALQRTDLSQEQSEVLQIAVRTFGCYVTEDPRAAELKEELNKCARALRGGPHPSSFGCGCIVACAAAAGAWRMWWRACAICEARPLCLPSAPARSPANGIRTDAHRRRHTHKTNSLEAELAQERNRMRLGVTDPSTGEFKAASSVQVGGRGVGALPACAPVCCCCARAQRCAPDDAGGSGAAAPPDCAQTCRRSHSSLNAPSDLARPHRLNAAPPTPPPITAAQRAARRRLRGGAPRRLRGAALDRPLCRRAPLRHRRAPQRPRAPRGVRGLL